MRKIPLKHLGYDVVADLDPTKPASEFVRAYVTKYGPPLDYRQQLVEILTNPQAALTGVEVRKRGKVADRIDDAEGETLLIEEADYAVIKDALAATRWRSASRNVREFLDDIEGAQEVEVAEAGGE